MVHGAQALACPVLYPTRAPCMQRGDKGTEDGLLYVMTPYEHTGCKDLCKAQTTDATKTNNVELSTGRSACAVLGGDGKYYEGTEASLKAPGQNQPAWWCQGANKISGKSNFYLAHSQMGYLCTCTSNAPDTQWTSTGTCGSGLSVKPVCRAEVNGSVSQTVVNLVIITASWRWLHNMGCSDGLSMFWLASLHNGAYVCLGHDLTDIFNNKPTY